MKSQEAGGTFPLFFLSPKFQSKSPPNRNIPLTLLRCRIISVVVLFWHALLVLALFRLVTAHRLKTPEEGRCISLSLVFLKKNQKLGPRSDLDVRCRRKCTTLAALTFFTIAVTDDMLSRLKSQEAMGARFPFLPKVAVLTSPRTDNALINLEIL